jgi:hypothetical protein
MSCSPSPNKTGFRLNFCQTLFIPRRARIHIDGVPLHIVQELIAPGPSIPLFKVARVVFLSRSRSVI